MTTSFRILGPLEVTVDGNSITTPRRNVKWFLEALLLDAGTLVPDEQLLELVWGHSGGTTSALRTAASRLRMWLREQAQLANVLHHTGSGYRLDLHHANLDSTSFRGYVRQAAMSADRTSRISCLRDAMNQWRGNVLAGSSEFIANSPGVMSLNQEIARCACDLADVAVAASRPEDALRIVESLALRVPYDEALQARLIKLLGACGMRAEGLRRFAQIRERFADELGVEPSRLLTAEYLALL